MNSSISNSRRYPQAFLIAVTLLILTVVGGGFILSITDYLPAPMFSNSFCLDEKLRFLRLKKNVRADYAVIGSSTGLNNIPSEVMMAHPRINQGYLNFSAWGLNMDGKLYYWNFIRDIARPKVLIIPIDLNEFNDYETVPEFNKDDVTRYLQGANPFWHYLKNHRNGFIERIRLVLWHRKKNDTQYTTKFDQGGGAPIEVTKESRITRRKWKTENYTKKRFVEKGYESLEGLLKDAGRHGVIVVIVQQPLREHYREDELEFAFIKENWDRVDRIAKDNGAYFFNMQDILPEDPSLYSDSLHLNRWAGEVFVKKLLERMETEGIFYKVEKMKG
jgi:hypothetical protein